MPHGGFRARVPKISKGYYQKFFKHNEELDARKWVTNKGLEIWGTRRWLMIVDGQLKRMRTNSHAVSVNLKTKQYERTCGDVVEYTYYQVSWYEDGTTELARCFNPSKYQGSLEKAEHAAQVFAAHKRAELTGGELVLPPLLEFEVD